MLAERAGVALRRPSVGAGRRRGSSKTELLAVNAWAEQAFVEALARVGRGARATGRRGGSRPRASARFRLGYAPGERGWLTSRAQRAGIRSRLLERAGLVVPAGRCAGLVRERFRGRLIFPIHDPRGRTLGFGGRILPAVERITGRVGKTCRKISEQPRDAAVPEAPGALCGGPRPRRGPRGGLGGGGRGVHRRDRRAPGGALPTWSAPWARPWATTTCTALRRLADRVVLVFDGDDAGQNAADRSLELFLGHEVDVRVLTLPENLDPCDFLLAGRGRRLPGPGRAGGRPAGVRARAGRGAVRPRLDRGLAAGGRVGAGDPRPGSRPDQRAGSTSRSPRRSTRSRSGSGSRSTTSNAGSGSSRRSPERGPRRPRRGPAGRSRTAAEPADGRARPTPARSGSARPRPDRPRTGPDRPERAERGRPADHPGDGRLAARRPAACDPPGLLRPARRGAIARRSTGSRSRLDDPAVRALAAGLLLPIDPAPLPEEVRPGPLGGPPRRGPRPARRARPAGPAPGPQGGPRRDRRPGPTRTRTGLYRLEYLRLTEPAAGHEEENAS